ncbi:hypothetical protein [Cupriavidus basilensis]|uniref:hypothetical protein n=1 Tax=Cupriavidus basilensis TaxID=68895 RepID=UPI003204BB74
MTVQDLLRHTSGLTYGVFGRSLVKDEYKRPDVDAAEQSNVEFIARLVRLLSPKTVAYMTADHLGPIRADSQQRGPAYLPGPGYGFGLGFGTRTSAGESATPGSVGDYYWGGVGGTYFWVGPREKTVAIWMMQAPGQREHYRAWFRNAVYAAMTP